MARDMMRWVAAMGMTLALALPTSAEEGWIDLTGPRANLDAFTAANTDWRVVASVALDPANPRRFITEGTEGAVIYNGPTSRTKDIVSKKKFGDVELHLEFNVPKGSNSGVKFEGLYEIQIADSWGVRIPSASQLGGIYPRSELKPTYHYVDKGFPPRLNAAKPPGEWQTFDVIFQAPRFDEHGKKVANARIVRATINGQVVQENVEVPYPTGHYWHDPEVATGPLLLQADHGPVAFRNIRVRPGSKEAPKS